MQTRKNISVLQRLVTTLFRLALDQSLTGAQAVSNDARLCLQAFSFTSGTELFFVTTGDG